MSSSPTSRQTASPTSRDTNERWPIRPGTIYALDRHDRHVLRATRTLRMVCVFDPPLTGREVHDADGSYARLDAP